MSTPDENFPPSPWTKAASGEEHLAYERTVDNGGQTFLARLSVVRSECEYPSGSGVRGWTLRFENRFHELSSTRSVGHAGSRSAALRELFDAMRTVNRFLGSADETTANEGTLFEALCDGSGGRGRQ
jgi:hypothetical protein